MLRECFGVALAESVRVALPLENLETLTRLECRQICPIPGVPPYWLGTVNHQGALLWVLDSCRFFDLNPIPNHYRQKLTVAILKQQIKGTWRRVALAVANLEGLIDVTSTPDLPIISALDSRYHSLLTAAYDRNENAIAILQPDQLFDAF